MFKNIDRELEKIGFVKMRGENWYGVHYQRNVAEYGYIQRLDIGHKHNGKHMIMSYQEGLNKDGFNNMVGLTYKETKLIMKKYRQIKRKYKWK